MARAVIPVSAVIPTRHRAVVLARLLDDIQSQDALPAEILVCDASEDDATQKLVKDTARGLTGTRLQWLKAGQPGAAAQRNQAIAAASEPHIWLLDDDMRLEPGCLRALHDAMTAHAGCGGVTATLVNENYTPPGRLTRALMRWFEHGISRQSYASACVGPGWTFMHDGSGSAPAVHRAEWLGGGCTLYRKDALPAPPFPQHFHGASLAEDLALSLQVGEKWSLLHVRDARAVHDSQGGDHKRSRVGLARQGLRNRHFIMTHIMGKTDLRDHFDFALMLAFGVAGLLRSPRNWRSALEVMLGCALGAMDVLRGANSPRCAS